MSIHIVEIAQPSVIDTVAVAQPSTVAIVEIRQGPAGTGGAGSVAWDDLTGTASDVPFEPVTAPAYSEGLVFYDSTDKSLTYYNDEADVSMNIGRELWVRVRNDSGSPILNGKVVYINDAVGQLPTIRLARADSATTSRVIGIATHDIGNNEFGYVTTVGEVKGLNTSDFQDGDLLFLSSTTAGDMTTTAPLAPNRVIQVATVLHAHITQGKLYCHPETDSIPSTGIVDSTATGRELITAATAGAARTTLGLGSGDSVTFGSVSSSGFDSNGAIVFNGLDAGDSMTFNMVNYFYGTGAASAHRTALGSGATGDALFVAASEKIANETLLRTTKLKTTQTDRNSSNTGSTYTTDSDFTVPVSAGKTYRVEFALYTTATSTSAAGGGFKGQFTIPSVPANLTGATSQGVGMTTTPGGTLVNLAMTTVGVIGAAAIARGTASINSTYHGFFEVTIGTTGGNLLFQWAQSALSADNTSVLANSSVTVIERTP